MILSHNDFKSDVEENSETGEKHIKEKRKKSREDKYRKRWIDHESFLTRY